MTLLTAAIAVTLTLAVPDGFNPETNMISRTTESGTLHAVRESTGYAAGLLAKGTEADIERAVKVLDAVIQCQQRHPDDAHYGNFRWYREDEAVEDLNAVAFTLGTLIPMMRQHGDRLPADAQQRVLESIRLGLAETEKLDVVVAYTNIALMDIVNSCLGGELLQDPEITARGRRKLVQWMAFTDQFGIPFEYNSPTYTSVSLGVLDNLARNTKDRDTRIRARTAMARLGLSVALHIHQSTGRWAGPHSRCYQPDTICEGAPQVRGVNNWIKNGTLPYWLADAMKYRPQRMQVTESAHPERNMGITTYHSPSFALGVSANEGLGGQGNSLIAQFQRNDTDRPGVIYSRYLINDKWMGDFYHATDRTTSRNLMEEGRFFGVQQGNRAIGLYTPRRFQSGKSAKATLICTDRKAVDEIWVGTRRIDQLPVDVAPGETVVISSGKVLIGVRPLQRTELGNNSPIRLSEIGGDLVLEMYNYLGPKKVFWELQWPGGFFQGVPRAGFYIEMAERSDYRDAQEFGRVIASGTLRDIAAEPFTYAGEKERIWSVEYTRDAQTLGIEIDLMEWTLKRRWTERGEIGWPMLESPIARETRTGQVTVGDAALSSGPEASWLFSCPETKRWVAGYHGLTPAPLTLTVPGGRVELDAIETGIIVWDNGTVTIEAVGLEGAARVTGGQLAE